MNHFRKIALAACATLSACAITVGDLKTLGDSFDGVVESPQPYAATYRTLRTAAKQCMEHMPLGTPVTIEGELDADLREGQIRQRIVATGTMVTSTVIEVKAGPNGQGLVRLYTLKGPLGHGINIPTMVEIKRWIGGDLTCTKT